MLFSKPTVPKPLEHWFNDLSSVSRLREILEDPAFELASATLLAAASPTYSNLTDTDRNAQRQAWLAGYHDFANDLLKLTKAPLSKGRNVEEWSHYE